MDNERFLSAGEFAKAYSGQRQRRVAFKADLDRSIRDTFPAADNSPRAAVTAILLASALLVLAILLALFVGCGAPVEPPPPSLPPPPPVSEPPPADPTSAALHSLHNEARYHAALPPLIHDARLTSAAATHAAWMARTGRLSHDGEAGRDPFRRIELSGFGPTSAAGENIAMGQPTPAAALAAWLRSPGHRANILSSRYTHAGYAGMADARGRMWWAVVFASPARPGSRTLAIYGSFPAGVGQ